MYTIVFKLVMFMKIGLTKNTFFYLMKAFLMNVNDG